MTEVGASELKVGRNGVWELEMGRDVGMEMDEECGSERVDAFSRTNSDEAQGSKTRFSACTEF